MPCSKPPCGAARSSLIENPRRRSIQPRAPRVANSGLPPVSRGTAVLDDSGKAFGARAISQAMPKYPRLGPGLAGEAFFTARALRAYMAHQKQAEHDKDEEYHAKMAQAEQDRIRSLMTPIEIDEGRLANFMRRIREAAEEGERQVLILRFPSAMCRDSGRAINNALPGWEETLVGVPAQIVNVWREHLKPLGYRLSAQVVEYPQGLPGDIGLFCIW